MHARSMPSIRARASAAMSLLAPQTLSGQHSAGGSPARRAAYLAIPVRRHARAVTATVQAGRTPFQQLSGVTLSVSSFRPNASPTLTAC